MDCVNSLECMHFYYNFFESVTCCIPASSALLKVRSICEVNITRSVLIHLSIYSVRSSCKYCRFVLEYNCYLLAVKTVENNLLVYLTKAIKYVIVYIVT